jgi:ubiquitin carboxyl-terminal hydrolase 47
MAGIIIIIGFTMLAYVSISLFRDRREEVKQLSSEERKEIASKEGSRVNRLGSTVSTYSPRKERALKIYLDTSPRRHDDVELD